MMINIIEKKTVTVDNNVTVTTVSVLGIPVYKHYETLKAKVLKDVDAQMKHLGIALKEVRKNKGTDVFLDKIIALLPFVLAPENHRELRKWCVDVCREGDRVNLKRAEDIYQYVEYGPDTIEKN